MYHLLILINIIIRIFCAHYLILSSLFLFYGSNSRYEKFWKLHDTAYQDIDQTWQELEEQSSHLPQQNVHRLYESNKLVEVESRERLY